MKNKSYLPTSKNRDKGEIEGRWDLYDSDRSGHIRRARAAAELTIPSILPPGEDSDTARMSETELIYPYQSIGSRGLNNLCNRLLLALDPPGRSSFRLQPEKEPEEGEEKLEAEKTLVLLENMIRSKIDASNIRQGEFEMLLHMANNGPTCAYLTRQGDLRVYRLDHFVVQRSPSGVLNETIVKDRMDIRNLPKEVVAKINMTQEMDSDDMNERRVVMYTQCIRKEILEKTGSTLLNTPGFDEAKMKKAQWVIIQEINGVQINMDARRKNPFICPRWRAVAGEDYGRGHVEDLMGDLRSHDGLSRALIEAAAISSRTLTTVPAGMDLDQLNEAENGEYISNPVGGEIEILDYSGVGRNMQFTLQAIEVLDLRLAGSFLLQGSLVRDNERVTATEIRAQAQEIEGVLGGIYTTLSQEMQLPLLEAVIDLMIMDEVFQDDTFDRIKPVVITGFAALGREQDLIRVQTLIQSIAQLGPTAVEEWVNPQGLLNIVGNALSLETDGLLRTQEEVTQNRQQAQATQAGIEGARDIAVNQANQPTG